MVRVVPFDELSTTDLLIDAVYLVTISQVGRRAYEEVREDRHRIIFLSGKDIAGILTTNGFSTPEFVKDLLEREFDISGGRN